MTLKGKDTNDWYTALKAKLTKTNNAEERVILEAFIEMLERFGEVDDEFPPWIAFEDRTPELLAKLKDEAKKNRT